MWLYDEEEQIYISPLRKNIKKKKINWLHNLELKMNQKQDRSLYLVSHVKDSPGDSFEMMSQSKKKG